MNPAVILRIFTWGVAIILLVASAGLYRGDFTILRWVVSMAGIILAYTAYRSKKYYWLFVFIVAAAVFNPIIPLYLRSISAWRVIDLIAAIAFGVFLWRYYDYYGKGYQFENYIASLFPTYSNVLWNRTLILILLSGTLRQEKFLRLSVSIVLIFIKAA